MPMAEADRAFDARVLLDHAIAMLVAYGKVAKRKLLDDFVQEYLAHHEIDDQNASDFLYEVLDGCVRYEPMLKVFLDALFHVHITESQRADGPLYTVLALLFFVRLAELGPERYMRFVATQEPLSMHTFHRFATSRSQLETWVTAQWELLYTREHIDRVFLASVVADAPVWDALVARLKARVEQPAAPVTLPRGDGTRRGVTVPQPFALTRPAARAVDTPIALAVGFTAKPVPATTYSPDGRLVQAVEAAKADARAAVRAKHAAAAPFAFRTMHATEKKKALLREAAVAETGAPSVADKPSQRPAQRPGASGAPPAQPVRLTAAAILREEAVFVRQLEEERRVIEAYESGQYDAAAHARWHEQRVAADAAAQAEAAAERRAEAQRARVAAKTAREAAKASNRATAAKVTEIKGAKRAERKAAAEAELARAHESRETVAAAREAARAAQERVAETKRAEAAAYAASTDELRRQAEAAAEAERAVQTERIRKIRALDRVPRPRVRVPSELAGLADLEARERLAQAKRAADAERELRREAIVAGKQAKTAELTERMARVAQLRARRAGKARRVAEVNAHQSAAQVDSAARAREERVLAVHERLVAADEAHAVEAARLRRDERAAELESRFLLSDREALELVHNADLERARARTVRDEQAAIAQAATVSAEAHALAVHARTVARSRAAMGTRIANADAARALRDDSTASAHAAAASAAARRAHVAHAREHQAANRASRIAARPYDEHVEAVQRRRRERSASQAIDSQSDGTASVDSARNIRS